MIFNMNGGGSSADDNSCKLLLFTPSDNLPTAALSVKCGDSLPSGVNGVYSSSTQSYTATKSFKIIKKITSTKCLAEEVNNPNAYYYTLSCSSSDTEGSIVQKSYSTTKVSTSTYSERATVEAVATNISDFVSFVPLHVSATAFITYSGAQHLLPLNPNTYREPFLLEFDIDGSTISNIDLSNSPILGFRQQTSANTLGLFIESLNINPL